MAAADPDQVHGDWRTASRLYGNRSRVLLAPVADRLCVWALRRADQVRAIGDLTVGLVHGAGYDGPIDRYITFSAFEVFTADPPAPPSVQRRALFIGVLERYKGTDVLVDAWPTVVASVPRRSCGSSVLADGPWGGRVAGESTERDLLVEYEAGIARLAKSITSIRQPGGPVER